MGMPAVDRRWTAREVRQLIADSPLYTPRYELADGELLVTPSPSQAHQRAVLLLAVALHNHLGDTSDAEVYVSPSDVELEPEFLSQPDVFVVPKAERARAKTAKENIWRRVVVAIEVLSPSSGRHDRVRKRLKYQKHVDEYWIVDLESLLVERWRSQDARPEILTERLEWDGSGVAQPFALDLQDYFARVVD